MNRPRSLFQKYFLDFFPPPRFLEMPSVGLNISDEVIRFAEIKQRGSEFKIGIFGEEKIPKGIIEEGYVKNKDELKKILINLKEKYNLHFVRASLPEEKSYLFRTQIPYMEEVDIRNALRFKIEENVPLALNDAVFDYHYITQPKKGDTKIDLGVAVIHSKVVDSYLDVITGAGLVPLKLRIESQAIAHAVIPKDDHSAFIIVAVQESKTILALVSKGVIQFSSTISISGASLQNSLQKSFSITAEEAQTIRTGTSIKERDEIFDAIMNSISVIRDEIQKPLIFWSSKGDKDNKTIKKIFVTGSDALLGVDTYLGQSTGIPTEIANVWVNIVSIEDQLPPINQRASLDYGSALGLALPYD